MRKQKVDSTQIKTTILTDKTDVETDISLETSEKKDTPIIETKIEDVKIEVEVQPSLNEEKTLEILTSLVKRLRSNKKISIITEDLFGKSYKGNGCSTCIAKFIYNNATDKLTILDDIANSSYPNIRQILTEIGY
jgi:hypothetical protein